jgi:pimeloyl-ACP methyl ester carboxylesterase
VRPPLWREGAAGLELAALLRSRVWRGEGVADGGGRPVLLIPGFLAGDGSLGLMAQWLARNGYRPKRARMRSNAGCSGATLDWLEAAVRERAEATGSRVALVGQSRGGTHARALAVRAPDVVSGVVTLGSPVRDELAVHPLVLSTVRAVATLGDRGMPGLFTSACSEGPCCDPFRAALAAPFPRDVGFVCVYSRTDGIVDWRACLDPAAEHAEVRSTHVGMNAHRQTYRAIAGALERFGVGSRP